MDWTHPAPFNLSDDPPAEEVGSWSNGMESRNHRRANAPPTAAYARTAPISEAHTAISPRTSPAADRASSARTTMRNPNDATATDPQTRTNNLSPPIPADRFGSLGSSAQQVRSGSNPRTSMSLPAVVTEPSSRRGTDYPSDSQAIRADRQNELRIGTSTGDSSSLR